MDSVASSSSSSPKLTARRAAPTVAIVVPVFVEPEIDSQLGRLVALSPDELIVTEAGERATSERLRSFAANGDAAGNVRIVSAERGRARQMNAGAVVAQSEILFFVHADTVLPANALSLVRDAIARGAVWGRFDVRLSGAAPAFRVIERAMNWRSALTGIATGDQTLFVRRDVFDMLGGFAPIALMEDIEFSRRLKSVARPFRIRMPVITSSRRWERDGIARTVLTMWMLRALYALGASPRFLARLYR
jgi:rSAM/selenodomain-associated transferase 2